MKTNDPLELTTKHFGESSVSVEPQGLSENEIAFYQEQGYLVIRNVFSSEEIECLAEDVERVIREVPERLVAGNLRVRFKSHVVTNESLLEVLDPIADLSQVARQVAHDVRIMSILHDLYGEPALLFKDKLIYKPPGADGATLHQDWISWPGFPESFLTVLLAIDPFTAESGATEVYPRLHRKGYLSPRDGKHHVLTPEILSRESEYAEPVPLLLGPGDLAIFGCFVPHRSSANQSRVCRRGYFMSYNAASDGGDQYANHYNEFHQWIRERTPPEQRERLFFH